MAKVVKRSTKYEICTKCGEKKTIARFNKSKSPLYANTELLPNCKDCCVELYKKYYEKYKDHKYCLFVMCRTFDCPYEDGVAVNAVSQHVNKKSSESPFGIYLGQLWKLLSVRHSDAVTFDELTTEYEKKEEENIKDENHNHVDKLDVDEEIIGKWGDWYEPEDYEFLENKYSKLAENIIVDEGISNLIMQVCYTEFEQRKLRAKSSRTEKEEDRIDKLAKTMQDLIKNLGLDAKSKVERDNGKLVNSLGMAVAEYEDYDAIDILGELNTLKDVNNIEGYLRDYVLRPTSNNILKVNDFKLSYTEEDENFDYLDGKL